MQAARGRIPNSQKIICGGCTIWQRLYVFFWRDVQPRTGHTTVDLGHSRAVQATQVAIQQQGRTGRTAMDWAIEQQGRMYSGLYSCGMSRTGPYSRGLWFRAADWADGLSSAGQEQPGFCCNQFLFSVVYFPSKGALVSLEKFNEKLIFEG
jgi:hypothetical protein